MQSEEYGDPREALRRMGEYIRIPLEALKKYHEGMTAVTLGAIWSFANKKDHATFASVQTISKRAGLSPRQVQRHLQHLGERGWITRQHRGSTKTSIITITKAGWSNLRPYYRMPIYLHNFKHLTGASKLVLCVILGELCKACEIEEQHDPDNMDIEHICREGGMTMARHLVEFTDRKLAKMTGLSPSTCKTAVQKLSRAGFLKFTYASPDPYDFKYTARVPPFWEEWDRMREEMSKPDGVQS